MKKSLGPVVASALLLVVVVVATISFQNWNSQFTSSITSQSEQKGANGIDSRIEFVEDNIIYFRNGFPSSIDLTSVSFNSKTCNILPRSLNEGMNEISLGSCNNTFTEGRYEVSVVTSKGVYNKYDYLRSVSFSGGFFIDSAVEGLNYNTSSGFSGRTLADGSYKFNSGDTVTFSVGNVELGTVNASEYVTPLSLFDGSTVTSSNVLNVVRFFLTLDSDGDSTNGITINSSHRAALSSSMNFDQSTGAFETAYSTTLDNATSGVSMVSVSSAQDHINESITELDNLNFISISPGVSLSANESSIGYNGSVTLTWSSSNVDSCTAYGGWSGSKGTAGSESQSAVTSNSTFTLNCTGSLGNVSTSVTVTVSAPTCSSGSSIFSYTGSDQTFTVPTACSLLTVKLWGAGGGGATASPCYSGGSGGGAGFTIGNLSVSESDEITVIVGEGGAPTGSVTYGGGGRGTATSVNGGAGGGRSAIRDGSTELMTAGGGGGSGSSCSGLRDGGVGGGTSGGAGTGGSVAGGGGGSGSGGSAGSGGEASGVAGSQYTGGDPSSNPPLAGGGGGWYGGGSGGRSATNWGGGGGGSGYCGGAGVSDCTTTAGSGTSPAGTGDSDYNSSNGGGGAVASTGENGLIVIYYS